MGQPQENEVQVRVTAETSALKPGMEASAQDVEKATERMKQAVSSMNSAVDSEMRSLASSLGNVHGMMSAVFSVLAGGSFSAGIDETRKLTGEAKGLAKALGISTMEASALNIALGDIYSSSETFIGSSQMLGRQLRTNEEGLNAMGLKTRDANGEYRNMKDLMFDAIKVLNGYKEGTDRALAAQFMFGRGGAEVMSMLKMNNDVLDEAKKKQEELGLTIGKDNVDAVTAYKAAMNDVGDVISGLEKAIGESAMPALTDLAKWLSDTGPAAVNAVRNNIDTLSTVAIGTIFTGAVKAMSTRLVEASSSLMTTVQATRLAAAEKISAAQATAASTAAIKEHSAMLLAEAEASVASATGMARLSLVTTTLIPARERHEAATLAAAAAERALAEATRESSMALAAANTVINALGGPLGAVITLLGVGATAWAVFGDHAKNAVKNVNEEMEKGREVLARYQREKKFGTGDEGQLRATLEAVENRISLLVQSSGSAGAAEKLAKLRKEAEELQTTLNEMEGKKSEKPHSFVEPPKSNKAAADKTRMPDWEAVLAEQKAAYMRTHDMYEMSLADEKKYWTDLKNAIGKEAKEYGAVRKKEAEIDLQILKKKAQDEKALAQESIDSWKGLALQEVDIQQQSAQQQFDLGLINKKELLQQELEFQDQKLQIELAAIELRLVSLQKDEERNKVDIQKANDQKLALEKKYQADRKGLENKLQMDKAAPELNVAKGMESSFATAINGMVMKAQTLRQALGGIFASIGGTFINEIVAKPTAEIAAGYIRQTALWQALFVKKQAENGAEVAAHAATETAKTTATVAGVEARVAAEEVGAGESLLIKAGLALKSIMMSAWEAMAAAFAAMAAVPVIGPVLAVGAGALAFATVAGIAGNIPSAEGGWDIPAGATGMMKYHEKEMMLPQDSANTVRSLKSLPGMLAETQATLTSAASADGGATHVHFHAGAMLDPNGLKSFLKQNSHTMGPGLRQLARNFTQAKP
ncbi:MAG TPA: hypothetical protein VGK09_10690 [Rhodocyclaceae bacterium]|jgi:hypothetical protein